MLLRENFREESTSIHNCHVAHDFYNPTTKSEGRRMPILSAGYRQENVREGCTFAFTRIKPMTKDYVSLGSNLQKSTALLFWVRCRKSTAFAEIIGKKQNQIKKKSKER